MIFLKIMPAYGHFPIWNNQSENRNIDPQNLLISKELCRDLYLWSKQFNNNLNVNNRSLSGFKSLDDEVAFTEKGIELKQKLEQELGQNYQVYIQEWPVGFYTRGITKYIKLMPDYECFPLWHNGKKISGDIDPVTLPLSDKLIKELCIWSDYYDSLLNWSDPVSSGFKCEDDKNQFIVDGAKIKLSIKEELGETYNVVYFYDP